MAIGYEFEFCTDEQAEETLAAAWDADVRYYDVSPWYGLGLAERRFGRFLARKPRGEFVISSKVGKLLRTAGHYGVDLIAAALQFSLTPAEVSALVVGTAKPFHILADQGRPARQDPARILERATRAGHRPPRCGRAIAITNLRQATNASAARTAHCGR